MDDVQVKSAWEKSIPTQAAGKQKVKRESPGESRQVRDDLLSPRTNY
jgi:hypothetical protein